MKVFLSVFLYLKKIRKTVIKHAAIVALIFVWIFSGWPQIWHNPPFPPKVEFAHALVVIQNDGGPTVSLNTLAPTFTLNVASGATMVVVTIMVRDTETIASVTDSDGDSYTAAIDSTGNSPRAAIYYSVSPTVNASKTITVTFSDANADSVIGGFSLTGTETSSPIDVTLESNGTAKTITTAISTNNTDSLIVWSVGVQRNVTFSALGTGQLERYQGAQGGGIKFAGLATSEITTSSGANTQQADHSKTSVTWRAVAAEIKFDPTANSLPTASSVSIDSDAGSITLTENTTKTVSCVGTVTDTNGFADINAVGAYLFRTGAGTTTATNNNYQYYLYGDSACVPSGGSGNTETYTCDFSVQFYAHPTDTGSPYPSDDWSCEMWPEDSVATGTVATDGIEMASLFAIDVTTTIPYGTVTAGSDTDTTNQTTTVTNTGNRNIDVELSGDLMCTDYSACTGGVIQPGQQKYADAAFTYDSGGTALAATTSPVRFELNMPPPQSTTTPVTDDVLWGTAAPDGSIVGSYTGLNTFTAIAD